MTDPTRHSHVLTLPTFPDLAAALAPRPGRSGLVPVMADALGVRFGGDPGKLADAAGVLFKHRFMGPKALMAYLQPTPEAPRTIVLLSTIASPEQRRRLLAVGLGHYFLRHDEGGVFICLWGLAGPIEDIPPRDAQEAEEFATAFLATSSGGQR